MTLPIVFGVFRVRAGGRWEERVVAAEGLLELGVALPIAWLARDLRFVADGCELILGDLLQAQVVLDSYLPLRYRGERTHLGISDERRIVAESIQDNGLSSLGPAPLERPSVRP